MSDKSSFCKLLMLAWFGVFPFATAQEETAPAPITVTNYAPGERLRYSVALIRGTLADKSATGIRAVNTTSKKDTREIEGLARDGKFKVLAELVPGRNDLILKSGSAQIALTLYFQSQTNPYFVRAVYLTDNSGDTTFQSPLENDPQNYAGKLDAALKLMQTFTAERLNDLGFGRRTFNLELDEQGKVKVHVFKCPASAGTYYEMNDQAWYANIASRLEKTHPTRLAKNFVIAAYTRFDPVTKKARAHTALGGGGQALFGSANMFTWPDSITDAQKSFMDTRPIDREKFFSDSVDRHTFWGAASTTIGACLHELGHTFNLPHTRKPMDIMTRGFDHFNRVFTLEDAISSVNKNPVVFKDSQLACFAHVSAAALVPSRWFALDERKFEDRIRTGISLEQDGNIHITCASQLAYVGFQVMVKGEMAHHLVPEGAERQHLSIPAASLRKRLKTDEFEIRIIDDHGNIQRESFQTLLAGPFVQNWRFAPQTHPWKDASQFAALDKQQIKSLQDGARDKKLELAGSAFVDMRWHLPAKTDSVAGYAFRNIRLQAPRKIKILSGSDDALRIWLNGKLIQQVLALRGAKMDSESCMAELQAGDNALLVEVSQMTGDWGFYLRLEGEQGEKLVLDDAGVLKEATLLP